jgi:hypothetical protein
MSELIDLALVTDAQKLVESLLDKHGINWFMARDGNRLMALDKSKIDLVVTTVVKQRERRGRPVLGSAAEHCRRQVRRTLIRQVAVAMISTGC